MAGWQTRHYVNEFRSQRGGCGRGWATPDRRKQNDGRV